MLRPTLLKRAAVAAALIAASAAAPASAASISIKGKCYVAYPGSPSLDAYGEPIPVDIEGLDPRRQVRLTLEVKGTMTSSTPMLTTDKQGDLVTDFDNWTTGMGTGPTKSTEAKVVVRDFWLGTPLATADLRVANIATYIDGDLLDIRVKRRWIISGLSEVSKRNTYYAHYFVKGKQVAKRYLGKTQDRCGFLKTMGLTYAGTKNVPDKFEIRVQASKKFKKDEPYIPTTFYKVGTEPSGPAPSDEPVM